MRSLAFFAALLLFGCAMTGCNSDGRVRGPSTNVMVVHAAPSFGNIDFLREERFPTTLPYRGAFSTAFEVGQYDFNLDVFYPGDSAATRERSFSETLQAETDYLFVITESGGSLEPIIVTKTPFAPTASNAEVTLVHAGPAFPAVSIYLTAPGVDLSAANPIGGAAFMQNVAPQTFAAGDYQLALTESGNPLNVLFVSPALTLAAGQQNLFVITDGAGEGTVPVVVLRIAGDVAPLIDVNAQSAIRVINAAADTLPRDLVVDDNFTTPLFSAVPYAAPTGFVAIAPGARKMNVTPAGNPGVIEGEATSSIALGRSSTTVVAGAAGDLEIVTALEDRRRLANQARMHIFNGAGQFTALDFFVLPPGTAVTGIQPLTLGIGGSSPAPPLPDAEVELTIRITGTQTIAYGPTPLTLADRGLYGVLAINGATAETVNVVLFDDFTP
jgi:hypothetical protein